jgi:putative transposase
LKGFDDSLSSRLTQEAAEPDRNRANHRNGYSKKTVLMDAARIEIAVPRDRAGTFDPQLIAKYQRRIARPHQYDHGRGAGRVGEWQNRPLEPVYAIVFFDCLRIKIRDERTVRDGFALLP